MSVALRLKHLYELQMIDSEIDKLHIIKGELPVTVSDLEDEIAGLETRSTKLEASCADMDKDIANHKMNIKQSEEIIKKYEKQLNSVKNNREYDALNKEINLQRLEIQLSEKKQKEVAEQIKLKKTSLDGLKERLTAKQKELVDKREELNKIIEKTEKEEAVLGKKSDKNRKGIEERLLTAYDKIRTRYRNGLAVVTVQRNACGGCYNQIPPQVQLEIGLRKKIIACEHCGRVLVDEHILEVES